jgi:hypothetical protein
MNDESLRAAYRELHRRAADQPAPDVDVDSLLALADGTIPAPERETLLDVVLAHPETAHEFIFLADIARATPKPARRSPYMMIAASVTAALFAATLIVDRVREARPDVLRGAADGPVLLEPAAGAFVATGTQFVWNAFPPTVGYRVELIDEEGAAIAEAETRDTTWLVPQGTAMAAGTRLVWWVTALLPDGTERRATPRAATSRP